MQQATIAEPTGPDKDHGRLPRGMVEEPWEAPGAHREPAGIHPEFVITAESWGGRARGAAQVGGSGCRH